jgi:hypothetical protein
MNKHMNKWLVAGALFAFGFNPEPKVEMKTETPAPSVPQNDHTDQKQPETNSGCGYSAVETKEEIAEPVVEQKEVVPARTEEVLVPEAVSEIVPAAEAVQN